MPEMPELEVLVNYFTPRISGRKIEDVWVSPRMGFLLRTGADEMVRDLKGATIKGLERRGKFLLIEINDELLVINPMLGGRLQWAPEAEKRLAQTVFMFQLDKADQLRFLDYAKMGRVYRAKRETLDQVPGWSDLGPEAVEVSEEEFAKRIRRHPGIIKDLLRNQAFIAGVGNAYSDEILHDAQFLPLRKRTTLTPEDIARLHGSTGTVLRAAVEAISAQRDYEPHKQDRSFMKVHMKGGQACPRCGKRILQLTARGEITNFCRGCQF